MDEQARLDASLDIAEPLQDLCPAVDPLHVRRLQADAQPGVLRCHGGTVALPAKRVRTNQELAQPVP